MIKQLLVFPVRVGMVAVKLGMRLAGRALGLGQDDSDESAGSMSDESEAPQTTSPPRTGARSREEEPAPPISPPAPERPEVKPTAPLSTERDAKTLDDEPVVVAEFAELGAADGAGAQVDVDVPWEGYSSMAAEAILARLEQLDMAQLAVVQLYERTHKNRRTVLEAAERRLRSLTSPPSASE
jgi:hypothetical protein